MNPYPHFGAVPVSNDYQNIPSQTSNLPHRASSWFRRPARISKHASMDSSPRTLVRRKTTALVRAPSRQKSVNDGRVHQKHFSTSTSTSGLGRGVRPMSWHSSGLEQAARHFLSPNNVQHQNDVSSSYFLGSNFTTSEVNGAMTPLAQPDMGEPFIQDMFTPLDGLPLQDFENRYAFLNEFSADKDNFHEPQCGNPYALPNESHYQYAYGHHGIQKQLGYCVGQLDATAPPTPDITPLQTTAGLFGDESLHPAQEAGTGELIGMGLYDAPSPTPPSMSFLSGPWDLPIRPSLGKGLKLEETFQPPPVEDEESDVGEGDDEEEEEADEEEGQKTAAYEPGFQLTPGLTTPYLELEQNPYYPQQNAFEELRAASDYNDRTNAGWGTQFTGHYGWV